MNREKEFFWRHVDALLDERRDPLDDAWVRRTLESRPELLEDFAAMRASTQLVARSPRETATIEREAAARPWVTLTAIVAACILIGLSTYLVTIARRAQIEQLPMPTLAADARVHAMTTSTVVLGPDGPRLETSTHAGRITSATLRIARRETPSVLSPFGHEIRAALAVVTTQIQEENRR